jgi:hypothetical protein
MKNAQQAPSATFAELWQHARLQVTDEFTAPPVILRVDDSIVGTLGNFSASTGKAKSKKTFNVSAIVAAVLTNGTILNYSASLPPNKQKILYADTEQSRFHCQRVLKRILQLSELPTDKQPAALEFLSLRKFSPKIRLGIIEEAIYHTENLGLVIIDGVRDLAYDINSPSEAIDLITKDEFDKDMSSVTAMYIRDIDFELFAFRINENSLPELVNDYQPKQAEKKQAFDYQEVPANKHREALENIFSEAEQVSYTNLIGKLQKGYATVGYSFGTNKAKLLKVFLENKRMIVKDGKCGADVLDRSIHYREYKDLNDYLCGKKQFQEKKKSRGIKM